MSKTNAETALALFERTNGRGDVLSIHLEDGAKLAALPKVMFAEIAYPLFQWWVHGTYAEPTDPRDKMVFEGLKAHQTENAVKRGVNLKNWAENASKGGRPKTSKKPSGNQAETKRVQLEEQEEVQVEDASTSLQPCNSSSVDGADRGGLTPPVCPSLSEDEAKKILSMDAPELTSHKEMQTTSGKPNAKCYKFCEADSDKAMLMVATAIYPNALEEIGGDAADTLQSILDGENNDCYEDWDLPKSFHKTPIGGFLKSAFSISEEILHVYLMSDSDNDYDKMERVFKRAIVAAYLASQDPKVKNPTAFILARLKKVLEAVKVLEGANPDQPQDQKPLTELDY